MDSFTELAVRTIESIGEPGVGLLIALETIIPPIPSEVVLPFAGFTAAQGTLNAWLAWLWATVGSLVGATVFYGIGLKLTYERLYDLAGRRWFFLFSQKDLDRGFRFFDAHGSVVVLVGRFVPFVRSVVSIPAGLDRMPFLRFLALTGIGSGIWNAAFIYAGVRLGEDYAKVQQYVDPASKAVVGVVLVVLVGLAIRKARGRHEDPAVAEERRAAVEKQRGERQARHPG